LCTSISCVLHTLAFGFFALSFNRLWAHTLELHWSEELCKTLEERSDLDLGALGVVTTLVYLALSVLMHTCVDLIYFEVFVALETFVVVSRLV
jgi:hypothetical protein